MENQPNQYDAVPQSESFRNSNLIIVMLTILLILSFVGINLLDITSNIIKAFVAIFGPLVKTFMAAIGYTTGTVINKTADIVSDTAKSGIDIAEGTVQDLGNLMISASSGGVNAETKKHLNSVINTSKHPLADPDPDSTENPIQNPIASKKGSWCLVGEYKNKRGCLEVTSASKCMSEQIFPTKKMCLNPAQGA
jgi:hypothetical protein